MIRCGRSIVVSLVPIFVSILFESKTATGYLQRLISFSLFFLLPFFIRKQSIEEKKESFFSK
jgi:hypothetical protein